MSAVAVGTPTNRAWDFAAVDAVGFEVAPQPPGCSTRAQSRGFVGKNVRAGAEAGLNTRRLCRLSPEGGRTGDAT
jgi:hypothetical protein